MKAAVVRKVDWKQWEGDVAGGEFPLEQFLGSTGGSAVFRTRTLAGEAAIKLVPSSKPWSLVDEWNRAGALDHPHLLRILKTGTWRKNNVPLAYLVMEYADEQLGTVLEERALSGEEARETFLPVAETLAFLHGRGLAHGRVKARNILAVKDLLKLSSESVATGDPAADMRALGAVMVHALTGQPANGDGPSLPAPFDEIARNSMGANGRAPCSAADVVSRLRKKSADPPADTTREIKKPGLTRYAIAFALLLVVVLTFGSWWRNRAVANQPQPAATVMPTAGNAGTPTTVTPPPGSTITVTPKTDTPKNVVPPAAPAPPEEVETPAPKRESTPPPAVGSSQGQVVARALPEIPAKARRTIHGVAQVVVRVAVDESGAVSGAKIEPGGSRYFGKLSLEAARKWRFAPASGSRDWLLRFEITRTETKAFAAPDAAR